MDQLAGLPGSPLAEVRRQRPDVVRHLQASDDVIFTPDDDGGLIRAERAAAGLRIAHVLRDTALRDHYGPAGAARPRRTLARSVGPARRRAAGAGARSWRMSTGSRAIPAAPRLRTSPRCWRPACRRTRWCRCRS